MEKLSLKNMSDKELDMMLQRPSSNVNDILPKVRDIIEQVRTNGNSSVRMFTKNFDGVDIPDTQVSSEEFSEGEKQCSAEAKAAIFAAEKNITTFHTPQLPKPSSISPIDGVLCRLEWRPIQRVGIYVPGGSAPLVSTLLMLCIPAKLAGCKEIIVCTPPRSSGQIAPEIIFAAKRIGIDKVFKVGGAQAIAAMACGTETIPRVDKIFGPGNRFVTAAKMIVTQQPYNVVIDIPAGPTELLIISDETSDAQRIAAELIAQSEHGEDSRVLLVSTSSQLLDNVEQEIERQLQTLPRREIAKRALDCSSLLLVESIDQAIDFSNSYAPEHLLLAVKNPEPLVSLIENAGSVFLGLESSVVFGDYNSGTNHTLPTGGWAKSSGGVTVTSFMKPIFFQTIRPAGAHQLAASAAQLARSEGLEGHARAAELRREARD